MEIKTAELRRNSFEPRFGIAQLIFGIIYGFIAGIGLVLAIYTWTQSGHQHPWTQYFFVLLFGVLAAKSFFMYAKTRILYSKGTHTVGKVEEIIADKGLTYVRGFIELPQSKEPLHFESRYAGMSIEKELHRFLDEQHSQFLPALLVDEDKNPKGMFLIKTHAGHLDPAHINSLKTDRK